MVVGSRVGPVVSKEDAPLVTTDVPLVTNDVPLVATDIPLVTDDAPSACTKAVITVAVAAQKIEVNGLDAPVEKYRLYVAQNGKSAPL